jgi:hypothetical protein
MSTYRIRVWQEPRTAGGTAGLRAQVVRNEDDVTIGEVTPISTYTDLAVLAEPYGLAPEYYEYLGDTNAVRALLDAASAGQ